MECVEGDYPSLQQNLLKGPGERNRFPVGSLGDVFPKARILKRQNPPTSDRSNLRPQT